MAARKMHIENMAFDHGFHVELPVALDIDVSRLNSNPVIQVAQIFVRELNALGYKVSWKKNLNNKNKKEKKDGT